MKIRNAQIVGGGPGGLYLAVLLRGREPSLPVTVHERTPPEETFGFGVGFTGATLRQLAAADPESHAALLLAAHPNPKAEFVLPNGSAPVQLRGNIAIERAKLLQLLVERAEAAGVELAWGSEPRAEDLAAANTIVVAADGAGSATRERLGARVGAKIEEGDGHYIWCAADVCLPRSLYVTAETEHGTFVAHAYPYAADRSTFLVEAAAETLRSAGLDRELSPGASDEQSLGLLQEAFAEVLGPGRLIGNKSQWRRFRTVSLERWHDGNLVFLGDAAHTAHYSVGSGTKIAMEDSIALAEALVSEPDERSAFESYEAARRPPVSRLQQIARRSQLWWESFPERSHLPPQQLALAFLTRTGNVGFDDIEGYDPLVLDAAATAFGAAAGSREAILGLPLEHRSGSICGRLIGPGLAPWPSAAPILTMPSAAGIEAGPGYVEVEDPDAAGEAREHFPQAIVAVAIDADGVSPWQDSGTAAVERARNCIRAGCDAVRLDGADRTRSGLLDRLDLAERIRLGGGLVAATCPAQHIDDGVIALAAGRIDLVAVIDEALSGERGKDGRVAA